MLCNFWIHFCKHCWRWTSWYIWWLRIHESFTGPEGCKNGSWICHSHVTHSRHLSVMFTHYKYPNVFYMIFFTSSCLCTTCVVEYTCFWKHFYLNFAFWGRNDTVYFLNTKWCWNFLHPLFEHHFCIAVFQHYDTGRWWRNL